MRYFTYVVAASLLCVSATQAQQKMLLQAKGFGSLSGKVIDAKTRKPVADVVVFLKAPDGKYFPIDNNDKVRKAPVVINTLTQAFEPKWSGHFPAFFDGQQMVETGEKVVFLNPLSSPQNVRVTGNPKLDENNFNRVLSAGAEMKPNRKFQPQASPISLNNDINSTTGLLFVFDHPYFAVTKKDGTYKIPRVPAAAEIAVMAWKEDVGWLLSRDGQKMTFAAGKKGNTFDFVVAK